MNDRYEPVPPRRVVHVVVPDAIDDPARPSGGNRYDRAVCNGLSAAGWRVHEHLIPDAWPRLGGTGSAALARALAGIPDNAIVLVDGLIAFTDASSLVPAACRIRIVPLVHALPADETAAAGVLTTARAVIATSDWLGNEVRGRYALGPDAITVAVPGVERRAPVTGRRSGRELLCVGAIAPHKGQDVLLAAVARLDSQRWHCSLVGGFDHDPPFARRLRHDADRAGLAERVTFTGALSGRALEAAFTSADVLVHPSRVESYGMVVTEALAHGLPVITSATGGLVDALGTAPDGARPGLVVPAGDAAALGQALAAWLADGQLRRRLRGAARRRRLDLPGWPTTAERVAAVLESLR